MTIIRLFTLLLLFIALGCKQPPAEIKPEQIKRFTREALLTTRFNSLEDLKTIIQIEYGTENDPYVRLSHSSNGQKVISLLTPGVSEGDFVRARVGSVWDRVVLGLSSPYAVTNRKDLLRVLFLGRRRYNRFKE